MATNAKASALGSKMGGGFNTGSSTPPFNKQMGVGAVSAAAANALPRGRGAGRRGPMNARTKALNNVIGTASDVGKTFGNAALDVGKSLARSPFRVASSLYEIPRVLKSGGKETMNPYKVPGLGEIKTYSREAQDKIKAGDGSKLTTAATILGVGGQAMLDTAALGSAAGAAKKFFVKGDGTTSAATNVMRKVAPKTAAKFDQLTYRMYKGAPMGWQLRAQKALNLPFWKMNPNL